MSNPLQFRRVLIVLFTIALLAAPVIAWQAAVEPAPVEDDMHEFMEYMFEPAFKRVRTAMASEPADRGGWKAIKGDSLVLAEACNLLLSRGPEEKGDEWKKLAAVVRGHGSDFYGAAKKRDFAAARKSYESMVASCNKCHQIFADGEHQLTP
ncbi:MAG: hypothetical protein KDB14_19250 [Planctomycetales bacterium]|nr:hypothetical protein [Planctomycetales bacterium]